jgi:hypothetical protein
MEKYEEIIQKLDENTKTLWQIREKLVKI